MDKQMYLTQDGLERLKNELLELTSVKRKEVAQKIKVASAFGDRSENAEYDEAKEQQSFIEGRIQELEHVIKNATLITNKKGASCEIVDLGCTVHVEVESGKMQLRIVGSVEADPEKGHISHESPIGKALLGKKKGDTVEVEVPAGTIKYKIVDIQS